MFLPHAAEDVAMMVEGKREEQIRLGEEIQ